MVKLAPQERVQKRTAEQVVNVSVEIQSQLLLIQEVQGTMEVPQGRCDSVWQHQVRAIQAVRKTKEVALVRFLIPEINMHVEIHRQVTMFRK